MYLLRGGFFVFSPGTPPAYGRIPQLKFVLVLTIVPPTKTPPRKIQVCVPQPRCVRPLCPHPYLFSPPGHPFLGAFRRTGVFGPKTLWFGNRYPLKALPLFSVTENGLVMLVGMWPGGRH